MKHALDRFTHKPPLGAAALSVSWQESIPDPVIDALLHEREFSMAGAVVPVPLRVISAVLTVEELLEMVSCPVACPAATGRNWTINSTDWPALSVTGSETPDSVKPAPEIVAELIVMGAEPEEAKVTDSVAVVFSKTLTNCTLLWLTLKVGAAEVDSVLLDGDPVNVAPQPDKMAEKQQINRMRKPGSQRSSPQLWRRFDAQRWIEPPQPLRAPRMGPDWEATEKPSTHFTSE